MAVETVPVNEYNFSEITTGGNGDTQPRITNGQGRAFKPYEIVLSNAAPYYCGEVREADGIADGAKGRINIEHRRVIQTSQIKKDTTAFAAGDEVFFKPGGSGAAGLIVAAADKAAGSIAFGRIEDVTGSVGGSTGAYTYLYIRPYSYSPSRALET